MRIKSTAILACLLFGAWTVGFGDDTPPRVLIQKDSTYQYLLVSQYDRIRTLHSGSISHRESAMDLDAPDRLVFAYTRLMMAAFAFYPGKPQNVLIIGMGAGSLPRYVRKYYPTLSITNVELDPEIVRIAEGYFDFKADEKMRVKVKDGRRFLLTNAERFDIIFLDAYLGETIPFHLTTREFMEVVKGHLSPEGVVVANTKSSSRFADAEINTYLAVFKNIHVMQRAGGLILFAYQSPTPRRKSLWLYERMLAVQREKRFEDLDLVQLFLRHYMPVPGWDPTAPILTDDYAPVNFLHFQK